MTRKEKERELVALFTTGAMPIGELIDACFAFADANPLWISVEDGFPPFDIKNDGTWKYSDNVLIYSPLRGIFVGRYECDDMAGKTYWLFGGAKLPTVEDTGEGYCLTNVTHWMPLPQAPKKGGEG